MKIHIPTEQLCLSCNGTLGRGKKYCSRSCYYEHRRQLKIYPGAFKLGNKPISPFKKGNLAWNKGTKFIHSGSFKIGHEDIVSSEARKRQSVSISGSNNPSWKGGITTPDRLLWYSRTYRARKLSAEGSHTQQEWHDLKSKYGNRCISCSVSESEVNLTMDHIQPLSLGGSDYISNIQPLCQSCNSSKRQRIINYKELYEKV